MKQNARLAAREQCNHCDLHDPCASPVSIHEDPDEQSPGWETEQILLRTITLTMLDEEPTLVLWHAEDFLEALRAADDMGLPLTCPPDVDEVLFFRVYRALFCDEDLDGETDA